MSRLPAIGSGIGRLTLPGFGSAGAPSDEAVVAPVGVSVSATEDAAATRWRGLMRAIGHGLVLGGLFVTGYVFLVLAPTTQTFGFDAYAYWAVSGSDPYAVPLGSLGSFNYAPPVVLVADWFGSVEWWVFAALWTALLVGTVVWLGGSLLWITAALAFPPVALELYHGNIHLLLGAAVALGFRHPWTWSFVLLTKFTCGVGLLWFAIRREWRSLAIALGTTAAIVLVSLAIVPGMWADWFAYVSSQPQAISGTSSINIPLWLRMLAAVALVTWGALTDRRWTVVVAATLALPILWIAGLAMLVGVVPELRGRATGTAARSAVTTENVAA